MHTTLKVFICAALLVFATGCAGKSTSPSASNLWQQTQQGVLSAYQATKNTVSSIFGKLNFDKSKEKEKITKKNNSPNTDSFPARSQLNYEEEIKSGRLTSIKEPTLKGSGSKSLHIVPRNSQSLDELNDQITSIDRELVLERDPKKRDALLRRRNRLVETRARIFKEKDMILEVGKTRKKLQQQEKELENFRETKSGEFR
ncbi:MAG: hypothetical protein HOC91_17510 [Nitrospinaceae bacterium]|jgi:hypothetical protein|nr:hypothetical protein [Nitrospinaceae bacterium]MBT3433467.1 hypothetical protein [Nitrospinaceae bacterium]MBT4094330.1 hypothetical protein [Nitrospinaceae bacterium]MBT4432309.1 hypothetical protein [Nitrospinaceae bacterium]MBT5368867.1 hypothetical protein [Nitrospinaceae bacterium]